MGRGATRERKVESLKQERSIQPRDVDEEIEGEVPIKSDKLGLFDKHVPRQRKHDEEVLEAGATVVGIEGDEPSEDKYGELDEVTNTEFEESELPQDELEEYIMMDREENESLHDDKKKIRLMEPRLSKSEI